VAGKLVSPGTLFVVATPLGNLGDVTERAASVLRTVDLVAAEDTRRTRALLSHLEAHPRLISVHAHTPASRLDRLATAIAGGQTVALVSDAGTPTISDPGATLVGRVRAAGGTVVAVPGPSAVAAALSISGLPADRYIFLGFVPRKGADRRALLSRAAESPWTVVLFEAPDRLDRLLGDLRALCGDGRVAAVARELTKIHEELRVGTLAELEVYYRERAARGEVTVLVSGCEAGPASPSSEQAREQARIWLAEGGSRRDAAQRLVAELGLARNEAYHIVTGL
jgi:16S rRNA (cytidine1402-2'-O)-methyltransferase